MDSGRNFMVLVGFFCEFIELRIELFVWEIYFFICLYGFVKLWNVKKYVF